MTREELKVLSNENLVKAFGGAIVDYVKQKNFRRGGVTKKLTTHVHTLEAELLERLSKGAENK